MLWSLSLGLTNALQFTGPNQINADDDDDDKKFNITGKKLVPWENYTQKT